MTYKFERVQESRDVTWSGATQSAGVKIVPGSVFSIYLPTGFVGTALTVQSLEEDGTWADLAVNGAPYSTPITVGDRNVMKSELFCGCDVVRFVSTASETIVGKLGMAS